MRKMLIAALLLLSTAAHAEVIVVTKAGIACKTKDQLREVYVAVTGKDYALVETYLESDCIYMQGLSISVIERGEGISKIRVYAGDAYLELFAPTPRIEAN